MKKVVKILAFITLCIVLGLKIMHIYQDTFYGNWNLINLYELPENSIDVLAVGDSHVLTTTNPAVLWKEQGIAAYTLSSEGQDIWISYHDLVEGLKTQHPKLLILDIHNITTTTEYSRDGVAARGILGMKPSRNKWEVIKATVPQGERLDYFLEWPISHSRYRDIQKNNFEEYWGDPFIKNMKGCHPLFMRNTPAYIPDISGVEEITELPEKTELYLRKIIELAKKEDIPLLLMAAPYWLINEEEQKLYNRVEEIAMENQVDYVNFNLNYEEIGLIPEEDYADPHHLSYTGAEKFSSYLGDYLKENYDLDNHHGDSLYTTWNQNQHDYEKLVEDYQFETVNTMEDVFKLLNNPDYTMVISTRNTYKNENVGALLMSLGIDDMNYHTNGIWLIKEKMVIGQVAWGTADRIQYKLGDDDLVLSLGFGQDPAVMYAGDDHMHIKDGVNIFVYSEDRQCVVASLGFDATNGYEMRR